MEKAYKIGEYVGKLLLKDGATYNDLPEEIKKAMEMFYSTDPELSNLGYQILWGICKNEIDEEEICKD